jgi:hypothetical protein
LKPNGCPIAEMLLKDLLTEAPPAESTTCAVFYEALRLHAHSEAQNEQERP